MNGTVDDNEKAREIRPAINKFQENFPEKKHIPHLGLVVANYHSRRKSSEQKNRGPRPPSEEEAELCIAAAGSILVDLGWADW